MLDAIRELKVDELENVVGGGRGAGSAGSDTDGLNPSQTSKTLKSIVWGNGRC